MRIAFVFLNPDLFRHFENVVRAMTERGYAVDLVVYTEPGNSPNPFGRALSKYISETPAATMHPLILRRDGWAKLLFLTRELINYSIYYKAGHPSIALKNRWKKYLPPGVWRLVGNHFVGKLLASRAINTMLRLFERMAPAHREIMQWFEKTQPDVVFASPFITAGSLELDYVKAAKKMGIPSAVAVTSWDNLTTKGTFHILPDWIMVWNQALKEEAVSLHDVPREIIHITGSPTFDYWFEMSPIQDRASFCEGAGLDPKKPFVVYLCSSRGMIEGEIEFIHDLASEMERHPIARGLNILVRPHPLNMLDWNAIHSDRIRIWPRNGEFTDTPETRQGYYHTLHYGIAAVGINTSAMIETAIINRPCISIIDPRYQKSQTGMGHFRHLLNGNFLYIEHSYPGAVERLARIMTDHDEKKENRQQFVHDFVRPRGLDKQASRLMADALERIAQRLSPVENL
jgi:hypothetical protein